MPVLGLFVLLCAGCGSETGSPRDPTAFVARVDHDFFPLQPGTTRVYEGTHDGQERRDVERTLAARRQIAGVSCSAVEQHVFLDNALVEITTEWYAQDHDGNVWKFGEHTLEVIGESLVPAADSWLAGQGDAVPWIAFSARPQVGDTYTGYVPHGVDRFHVLSLTATANVPAGTFENCLQVLENPDDPKDTDIILYSGGVGRVSEESPQGSTELVRVRRD